MHQHPAQMCQIWSYAQMLRYVIESDQTCLLLWDDRFIGVPFSLLEMIVEDMRQEPDFYAFQLRIRGSKDQIRDKTVLTDIDNENSMDIYKQLFSAFVATEDRNVNYKKCFTRKGLLGYDESIVWTPQGATWMLQCLNDIVDVEPDIKQLSYFELSDQHIPHYARCINLDNYICWGLRNDADKAIKAGKGIYCPRNIGFNFVDEPLAMGSDTEYLTPHINEEYQYYANELQLQILNR